MLLVYPASCGALFNIQRMKSSRPGLGMPASNPATGKPLATGTLQLYSFVWKMAALGLYYISIWLEKGSHCIGYPTSDTPNLILRTNTWWNPEHDLQLGHRPWIFHTYTQLLVGLIDPNPIGFWTLKTTWVQGWWERPERSRFSTWGRAETSDTSGYMWSCGAIFWLIHGDFP